MSHTSAGGTGSWRGASFELRLAVEFCVNALLDEDADLSPGAIASVQLQAPSQVEAVDDLVIRFESGNKWAIQAKAGSTVPVSFKADQRFGEALKQLYAGACSDQVDLSPDSLDRLILAVDHLAPASVTAFGEWLEKARRHYRWERFAQASQTNAAERRYLKELPPFLDAAPLASRLR